MQCRIRGFLISHEGHVITVTKYVTPDQFEREVMQAQTLLEAFPAKSRNRWGCDGIGYTIQRDRGEIRVCLSSVGPVQFKRGLAALKADVPATLKADVPATAAP